MNGFSFSHIPELVFGAGKLSILPGILEKRGKRILIVTGKDSFLKSRKADLLFESLTALHFDWTIFPIINEPSPEDIDKAVDMYRSNLPNVVVAIGGGSVIDAGKAISAMLLNSESTVNYLEGVGNLMPSGEKIPFVAIPTTAGTGSEATKNAVISKVGKNGFKSSLRHNNYIPDIALIDPELQLTCPAKLTACSGMDAFTQLLESYLSTQASPMTDTLALDGIANVNESLVRVVYDDQNNIDLRSKMAYSAWISGITLANAGLGTVHGFASSIGALYNIPHGVVCGTLMAETNRRMLDRVKGTADEAYLISRYGAAGRIFSSGQGRSDWYYSALLIEELVGITEKLTIPKLSDYGVRAEDLETIANNTSNKNNPVKLSVEDMVDILEKRL